MLTLEVDGEKTSWLVIRAAMNKKADKLEVETTKSVLTPEQLIPLRRPDAQPSSPSINF